MSKILRATLAAGLFLLLASAFGCSTAPYRFQVDPDATPIPHRIVPDSIVTVGAKEARAHVLNAIGLEPDVTQKALTEVRITDECSDPNYLLMDIGGDWVYAAHCHPEAQTEARAGVVGLVETAPARLICIHRNEVWDSVTWHESGHALYDTLSREAQQQWDAISRDAYGDTEGEFPRNGILTGYGGTNAHEGFAEWHEWLMCYKYHTATGETDVDLTRVKKSDDRYIRSLNFFFGLHVITPEEYGALAPLFTNTLVPR